MIDIFYEIINESKTGNVIIDNEKWPISFNTIIDNKEYKENDNNITLIIKNKETFFKLLKEYVNLELQSNRKIPKFYSEENKNKIKWIISYLFVNATTEEFINPIKLLERKISFLENKTFTFLNTELEIDINNLIENSKLIIKNESSPISMETPNRLLLSIKDNNKEFKLPAIYYGIDKDTCYIYSLLNPKEKKDITEEEKKYIKKINRFLYKINDKVVDMDEYYDYKNNKSDYYPEGNISDISVSFVLALNIFISLLKIKNISKIKAVPYLPLRYKSRDIMAQISDKKDEFIERNDKIQYNLTNKFIRTFIRLSSQNNNIEISSYPYELDEFLTIKIDKDKKEINNMILSTINSDIEDNKTIK